MFPENFLLDEASKIAAQATDNNPLHQWERSHITADMEGRYIEKQLGIKPVTKVEQLREEVTDWTTKLLSKKTAVVMMAATLPASLVFSGASEGSYLKISAGVVLACLMHGGYRIGTNLLEGLDRLGQG